MRDTTFADHYLSVQCTSQTKSRQVTYRYHFVMGTRGQTEAGIHAAQKAKKYQDAGWKTEIKLHDESYRRHQNLNSRRPR